jgi:amino acid adenylation domain-containing protein
MIGKFLHYVSQTPDHPAILIGGETYSYSQLFEKASAIARAVKDNAGDTHYVGLYTDNNIHTYAALLGILFAGKAFVPLNHKFPDERLGKIIDDAGIKLIAGCAGTEARFGKIREGLNYIHPEKSEIVPGFIPATINSGADAYILYTSGSTGVPKGIPITHENFQALLDALRNRFTLEASDRVLQAFELSFDVSLACVFFAWEYGSLLVVADLDGITAVNAFKAVYDHKTTFVTLPPSALYYLKRLRLIGSVQLPWVHTTLFTGEALPYKVVEEWKSSAQQSVVENAYGPTETTVWCLFYKLEQDVSAQLVNGLCPIGEGLAGIGVRIVDEKGADVKDGERGELWVSGHQIFHGYRNNPGKTAEVLFTDDSGNRWYKTGDIVVKNSKGNIVYVNRKDNQVQVNGFRVELGEVEHALRKASGIDVAVVLASEKNQVTELFGFLEGKFERDQVLFRMRDLVPAYMVPRDLISVSPMPVNTNGKIDKQLLRKNYLS